MKFEYKIYEHDFLSFQLFEASKSERIKKKKRNGWMLLTIGSLLFAFYNFSRQDKLMTIYFASIALLFGLFYPTYFNWRYKKHYATHIKDNYSNRFGDTETIEITNETILSKDKTGEGKIYISEIAKIDETKSHFFVKISTGPTLIIPKAELKNSSEIKSKFISLNLIVNDETNWSCK